MTLHSEIEHYLTPPCLTGRFGNAGRAIWIKNSCGMSTEQFSKFRTATLVEHDAVSQVMPGQLSAFLLLKGAGC